MSASLLIAIFVGTSERDAFVTAATSYVNGGDSVLVQIGYTIDRWGLRSKRLNFVAITHNHFKNRSPRISVDDGHIALTMPDAQVISPQQGQLFEIDDDGIRQFDERITWTEWQDFQKHQRGGFRASDLLRQVQAERRINRR